MYIGYLEGLLNSRLLGPASRVSDSESLGRTLESAFLTSSQVILVLLIWGAPLRMAGVGDLLELYAGEREASAKMF